MDNLQLEQEIAKLTRAMMTRNSQIGRDLIAYLRSLLPAKSVAGIALISIERLLHFDPESIFWSIQNLIPADIMHEIHSMTSLALYKQLIAKGFMPGRDFSIDASGKLLLNCRTKNAIVPYAPSRCLPS